MDIPEFWTITSVCRRVSVAIVHAFSRLAPGRAFLGRAIWGRRHWEVTNSFSLRRQNYPKEMQYYSSVPWDGSCLGGRVLPGMQNPGTLGRPMFAETQLDR